jgi:raffinose/stachyose/melibiose transport system permease protein
VYVAFSLHITILILSGFITGIPREMEESAVMEGSSILKAFFTIIFPLMNPAIVTVVIFNFITVWNDFFAGLVFISLDKDKTLQLGIARFQGNFSTNYSYMLAAIVLVLLPSVVVYVTIQDRIIKGITTGALKG